jgi:DNA-binding NtrC family response regulator
MHRVVAQHGEKLMDMAQHNGDVTVTSRLGDAMDAKVGIIVVVSGPDEGREFGFSERTVVGSGPNAGIKLDDPSVSRLHMELARDGREVRVRDLGSKNGTWLGGSRVSEAWLVPGARIRIGSTVLEARIDERKLKRTTWTGANHFGPLQGISPGIHALFASLSKVGPTESRVLIRGESGTGKELAARALHEVSTRATGPFVIVDGAGLSPTLADDELFGHVRGAFTGAHADRLGAFARAHGGTLFLDEVGDIPLEIQKKLLRALESGSVQRVGGSQPTEVDVRVISATHRPLEQMVNEGTFREDLLYRLTVVEVDVPPLRERAEDVFFLARIMLEEMEGRGPEAYDTLERALVSRAGYPWPGNVRELRNYVHSVAVLGHMGGDAEPRKPDASPLRVDLPYARAKEQWIALLERTYVTRILDETGGNISEAARRAELSRVHLSNLVGRLGLRPRRR